MTIVVASRMRGLLLSLLIVTVAGTFKFEPFRYGNYCGQGPEEKLFDEILPIDAIDELCKQHDLDYNYCFDQLLNHMGYEVPYFVHQLVAMRGLFPVPLLQSLSQFAPNYFRCTHIADKKFVNSCREILKELPHELRGDCSIGTGSSCLISSKTLLVYMIDIFESGLELDDIVFNTTITSSIE